MAEKETEYTIPPPTVQEHYYLQAAVIELQRLRASVDALSAAIQQAGSGERVVELKEPAQKVKPKRGEEPPQAEPLSMVEPEPQKDVTSLVEVEPVAKPLSPSPVQPLGLAQPGSERMTGAPDDEATSKPKRG